MNKKIFLMVLMSIFLFGLATTSYETPQIFTSGIIIISVEAVSMGAGAFLTEKETKEIDPNSKEIKKWMRWSNAINENNYKEYFDF